MKALVKARPEPGIDLMEVPIPEIGADEVLIKVKAASICGSDLHKYTWDPSMHMYAPLLPLILGHEFAGTVEKVGSNVKPEEGTVGQRVALSPVYSAVPPRGPGINMDGAYAEYVRVHKSELLPLPDDMSFVAGSLMEPIGVAMHTVMNSGLKIGETVVIIGPGPIGLLTCLMAKSAGAGKVIVVGLEKDKARLELAESEMGANYVVVNNGANVVEEVMKLTGGAGADIVYECSGDAGMVNNALAMTKGSGALMLVGMYADSATIDITTLVRGQKRILTIFGPPEPFARTAWWGFNNKELMVKAAKIVSRTIPIEDFYNAVERLHNAESIKEVIVFD